MHLIYGSNHWKNAVEGEQHCYLLTNGLGGFSSLTVTGANARNDHALLMASSGVKRFCLDTLAGSRYYQMGIKGK